MWSIESVNGCHRCAAIWVIFQASASIMEPWIAAPVQYRRAKRWAPNNAPDGHRHTTSSAERILFESRGQFRGLRGATDQPAVEGRDCLRFGGSGSDFAEEPVVRVESRSRWLNSRSRLSSRAPYL
jgi:hypothetical protein